ncbi:helix-turn-helix transcriptional regulator [Myxococcus xanthus]|uniref:Helix-turn-helix domain-containing protein n=1 Tax=Myxococcus xanthus TaxID=34 RepID=A0A7Y4MSZ9_MYXXA|nr:helix-turn-helix domain-containing protein [Myxococcus xanthus]NOJ81075.1 helix-turn-helix domain-containing protein [Myxococcus xanthus]NOJ88677.1 helix-turn-helix domain-containing protein [Myxococcus xanthus]
MAEDAILTLKEVINYLKHTERRLYQQSQEDRFPGFKFGDSWRFRLRDIEAWIEAQTAEVQRDGRRQ